MNDNVTTTKTATSAADRDEALIAFLDAGTDTDLATWARRHPESAADFAYAATARWAGEPLGVAETPAAYTAESDRVRAIGRETLAAFRATRVPVAVAAPVVDLFRAAKDQGLTPIAFAARLRVPYALCVKLQRRLIAPDSIPATVVREAADALNRRTDEIAAYFRMPPTLALGASYRADSVPTVGEQTTFAEALAADSQTTDEQRAFHGAA